MKSLTKLTAGIVLLAAHMLAASAWAQTCSCATVPLLGTMQSASPDDSQWFLATTYEFRDISDLVAGSNTIPDQTGRDRTSQAMVVELSRGLTDKWSISGLVSLVDHERKISGMTDSASGLGDGLFMVKYSPATISLYSKNTFSFGLGGQIPLGEDDAKNNGLTLAEDLQPSTGAYGGLIWAYYARALNDSGGAQVYGSTSYAYNGENDRDYRFGNSLTVTLGTSYQTQTPWGFSLELFYRDSDRDERDSVEIPNTGGSWVDIVPTVQYHVTEALALKASGKIPISRDLNDALQFSTKYAVSLSALYLFGGGD